MSHAVARAKTIGSVLRLLVLSVILVMAALAIQNNSKNEFVSFTRLTHLSKIPAPETPSLFEAEMAMTPKALLSRWDPLIAAASRRFKVPENWIRAVMRMESGGRTMLAENVPITSDAGAVGIMQVMPGTYEEMREQYGLGDDPYDPHDNVFAGAAYLRWLHAKYGYPAMFAAYNDGPGNLEDHLTKGRKLPGETRNYIASIARMLGFGKAADKAALVKFTRPDGSAVWIDSTKVSGLRAALPGEYDDNVQAVMNIGHERQAIREDIATAAAALRDHGGNV